MTAKTESLNKNEADVFLRFLVVGTSGTIVDFGLLTLLIMAGMPTLIANTLSFGAGTINNFVLNRQWTFTRAKTRDWKGQFFQFLTVSLIGLGLNNLIVWGLEGLFAAQFHFADWSYLPAKVIATGIVVFWNYFANRAWTFKCKKVKMKEGGTG